MTEEVVPTVYGAHGKYGIGKFAVVAIVLAALAAGLAYVTIAPIRAPLRAASTFLADNAAKPGVETTASGLQVEILEAGDGPHPTPADRVVVQYEGSLPGGDVFDSSYVRGQPAMFTVGDLIPGWQEGLQLMRPGGKARFVIPSDLAYGAEGAGGIIPPNSALVFEVELLGILPRG